MNNQISFFPILAFTALGVISHHYISERSNKRKQILFHYNKTLKHHLDQMHEINKITIPNVNLQIIHNNEMKESSMITLINNQAQQQMKVNEKTFADKYQFQTKMECFFKVKQVNDLLTLKEEFRWLECPCNRIIILSQKAYDKINMNTFSKLFNTKTKVITVSNTSLLKYLSIDSDNCFYLYYPPKLPFTIVTPEYIDPSLYPYFYLNPISLLLRHKLFRNEMVIDNDSIYLKVKGVVPYGETFHHKIKANLRRTGRHLFIFLPQWENIDEERVSNVIEEYHSMFDSVNITTSQTLAKSLGLYQNNMLLNNVPQLFAMYNSTDGEGLKYNLTYFHFKENYDLLLKGQLNEFVPQAEIKGKSNVIKVNSNDFPDKVMLDKSFKEFIVEVSKEDCPSCFILGKMFDHLSHKLSKHNIDKLRLFRIDSSNDLPFIGECNATPTYLFCRKNDRGKIEYICQLTKDDFFSKLKEVSSLDLSKISYHKNLTNGYLLYLNRFFEKENFDPDIDLL